MWVSECFFFFNDTATTESYTYGHTLALHDALPISAAETTTVSPSLIWPTSVRPTYAVRPLAPNTPSAASGSIPSASGVVIIGSALTTEYSCQPARVDTRSPSAIRSLREATTRPTPPPRPTSPIATHPMSPSAFHRHVPTPP